MPLRTYLGCDVSSAKLEPVNAAPTVHAELDDILSDIRAVCPGKDFFVEERYDGAWVVKPMWHTRLSGNLCTLWVTRGWVRVDVRRQRLRSGGPWIYPFADGPSLSDMLQECWRNM